MILRHVPCGTCCREPAGGMLLRVELPAGIPVDELYRHATAVGPCFAPGFMFGVHEQHPRNLWPCVSRLHPGAQVDIIRIGSRAVGPQRTWPGPDR